MADVGKDVTYAKRILSRGGLVAIPTETVYGLAANALDPDAVTKIFEVKERPVFDPLIMHVAAINRVEDFADNIPREFYQLAESFWPGPLTFILQKKAIVPDLVTSGMETVALRNPRHPLTLKLLQSISFPLAAPSANPFGYVSPTTVEHVQDSLGDRITYILNGGACEIGVESTIIGFHGGVPAVYRTGAVAIEEIERAIGQKIKIHEHDLDNPTSPGGLKSHYAPFKKLILGELDTLIQNHGHEDAAVLSFKNFYGGLPENRQFVLAPSGDLHEAAKNLFSGMRTLDKLQVRLILAEPVPNYGIGRAINDRLYKASSKS